MKMKIITYFFLNNILISNFFFLYCDAAESYQIVIQYPATEVLEWMINFHDLIMVDLILIICVLFFSISLLILKLNNSVVNKCVDYLINSLILFIIFYSIGFAMSFFFVHCDAGLPESGVTAAGFAMFFGISLLYMRPEKVMTRILKDSSGESFWVNLVRSRHKSEDLATGVDRYGITRYFTDGPDTYTAKHSLTECLDLQLIVNQNEFWPGDLATWYGVFAHTPGHTWYVLIGFGILSYLILSELNSYKSSVVEVIEALL